MLGRNSEIPAIPVRAIAERRVAEHFLRHDAVRADRAILFESGRLLRTRAAKRLLKAGVLREGQGGRLYLDAPTWLERRDVRRKRLTIIAAAAVAVAALLSAS